MPAKPRKEHSLHKDRFVIAALRRLAKRIRRYRRQRGISMQTLASRIGCTHYVIAHIEQVQNAPSFAVYIKLERALSRRLRPAAKQ